MFFLGVFVLFCFRDVLFGGCAFCWMCLGVVVFFCWMCFMVVVLSLDVLHGGCAIWYVCFLWWFSGCQWLCCFFRCVFSCGCVIFWMRFLLWLRYLLDVLSTVGVLVFRCV